MKLKLLACLLLVFGVNAIAQMTADQKAADFQQLAALYDKNYAPYEWKVAAQNFDLLEIGSWLDRVRQSKDDIEFMEILIDYVSSLNDAHDVLTFPTDFVASLGFSADIYDGKVLVDSVNRSRLPRKTYPFAVGDEIVSVDGQPAADLVTSLMKYNIAANERSTRRLAAGLIGTRSQARIPRAPQLGDSALIVIQRQGGNLESYIVPWLKTGTPITVVGPVPSLKTNRKAAVGDAGPYGGDLFPAIHRLRNAKLPIERRTVRGFGAIAPIFQMPATFVQRLGNGFNDYFFSGTFQAGGYNIGFIRIPDFGPNSETDALFQFADEIAYMQKNTGGLIIDDMRNPGGDVCYGEAVMSYLQPKVFHTMGFEIRATANWIYDLSSEYALLQQFGYSQSEIDGIGYVLADIKQAYLENRGRTGAEPLCGPTLDVLPATDDLGAPAAYTKPIMMLVDEMSASGADAFPAIFQDNQRGPLFGMRTMGAGGTVVDFVGTTYSEANTRVTTSLMHRPKDQKADGFPIVPYVENIGVRPEIVQDYMTLDNLLNNGKTFVQAFSDAMVNNIRRANSGN